MASRQQYCTSTEASWRGHGTLREGNVAFPNPKRHNDEWLELTSPRNFVGGGLANSTYRHPSTCRRCPSSRTSQAATSSAVASAPLPREASPLRGFILPTTCGGDAAECRTSNSTMRASSSYALKPWLPALLLDVFFAVRSALETLRDTPGSGAMDESLRRFVSAVPFLGATLATGPRGVASRVLAVERWLAAASANPGTSSMPRHLIWFGVIRTRFQWGGGREGGASMRRVGSIIGPFRRCEGLS